MMVYILTSGCYPDVEIEGAALKKEVAEHYTKLHSDVEIEEYELIEDDILQEETELCLEGNADIHILRPFELPTISVWEQVTDWCKENRDKFGKFEVRCDSISVELTYYLIPQKTESIEEAKKRLEKIMTDAILHIKSLVDNEGLTWEKASRIYNMKEGE